MSGPNFGEHFNQRQAIPLSAGDVFISILSDEPFTLVDHPRSRVAGYRELRKLEVDCVIHYGGGGAPTTLRNALRHAPEEKV